MSESVSSQLIAYLRELGPGALFNMRELKQRWPEEDGAIAGFMNRLVKQGYVTLMGSVDRNRQFRIEGSIMNPMRVAKVRPVRQPVSRIKGQPRTPCDYGKTLLTRQQVRDRLLELAAYFDSNGLAEYTEQELVAELGRRYNKEAKK